MAGETEAFFVLLKLLVEKGIITEEDSNHIEGFIYYDGE